MERFDVIIAGGGLAGATLAAGLASRGRRVAVIEAVARQAGAQPSYDDRTLALNAASLNILDNLGLLPPGLELVPIRRIRVSRARGFGRLDLDARHHGIERFGAVVVARELGNVLLGALGAGPEITEYCPDRLETFTVGADRVEVRLESGTKLRAALLIGADGSASRVRDLAGISCTTHDYGAAAMVFNVTAADAEADTAWERFTPGGPLALLPQPGNRLGVVWVDKGEDIDAAMQWPDDELVARLEARARPVAGGFSRPGRRARYPLRLVRAPDPVGERVVLIGNSANTVHPVSAQGFNLALRDVAGLIEVVEGRADPGAADVLARYTRLRRGDQAATVRYTDTLARAFTNPAGLTRAGAGIGLAAHALLPGLQRRLVQAAMGFRDPVPKLAVREP